MCIWYSYSDCAQRGHLADIIQKLLLTKLWNKQICHSANTCTPLKWEGAALLTREQADKLFWSSHCPHFQWANKNKPTLKWLIQNGKTKLNLTFIFVSVSWNRPTLQSLLRLCTGNSKLYYLSLIANWALVHSLKLCILPPSPQTGCESLEHLHF